jgi:hypothetical protein
MGVGQLVRGALEPYVGSMVADTCVRATTLSLGKTVDDLGDSDLPRLEDNIRRLLAPVAPMAVIEDTIHSLESSVAMGG